MTSLICRVFIAMCAVLVTTHTAHSTALVTDTPVTEGNITFGSTGAIYSRVAFSPDGRLLAVVRESVDQDLWASELALVDIARSKLDVAVPRTITKAYATYSAVAYGLRWDGQSIVLAISDGDVDSGTIVYDTRRSKITRNEWNGPEEDGSADSDMSTESTDRTGLVTPISTCFKDWDADAISSGVDAGHAQWLDERRLALFQARHVKSDARIWLLDLDNCTRTLLIDPGDSKSAEFRGWLSGAVYRQGRLAFVLSAIRFGESGSPPTQHAEIVIVDLGAEMPQVSVIAGLPAADLTEVGGTEAERYFLVRSRFDYCAGRLFAIGSSTTREITSVGASFCDASVNPLTGDLALVVRKGQGQDAPRDLWVVKAMTIQPGH